MWLLLSLFGGGNEQDKVRLEIVKIAGSIVVGTGGGAALLLAARRQRSMELGLAQAERDLSYKEEAASDARLDSKERRITELYASAAEQLASDKAPVRLAGLYALERLGNVSPDLRQTIVNLFCAYLRMPYLHPIEDVRKMNVKEGHDETPEGGVESSHLQIELAPKFAAAVGVQLDAGEQRRQEMQVRTTAQRLLSKHLVFIEGKSNPNFWGDEEGSGLDLDLQGATLDNWTLLSARVRHAEFSGARFYGNTNIKNSKFRGRVAFDNASFFAGLVVVTDCSFESSFTFDNVTFNLNMIDFDRSEFQTEPLFRHVEFPRYTSFKEARFHSGVEFPLESFTAAPDMEGAQLKDPMRNCAFLPKGWALGSYVGSEAEGWRGIIRDKQ